MGAEGYRSYYYPPKPCEECGEMLPAGTAHIHYTRWAWFRLWLRRLFDGEDTDD